MTKKLYVLDKIMGSGKTTAIFKYIEEHPGTRFIYISPYLDEVDKRVKESIASVDIYTPNTEVYLTKGLHLLSLLREGKNVACTHKLYEDISDKHLEYISQWSYTLIIDEEPEAIGEFECNQYKKGDTEWLLSKEIIKIHELDGRVEWIDPDNTDETSHKLYRRMADLELLYACSRSKDMLTIHMPIKLLQASERTILLTYLFTGSILESFLKLRGMEWEPFTDVDHLLQPVSKQRIKELIQLDITTLPYTLSSSWYDGATKTEIDKVSNSIRNGLRRVSATSTTAMWTAPLSRVNPSRKNTCKVSPRDFKGTEDNPCWIACSTRATNSYSHKKHLVHAFNRFPLQPVRAYLQDYGCPISDDNFALSELVQWIWRSAIRNGEPITLTILSSRMRSLFINWLRVPD